MNDEKPIWQILMELGDSIPPEEWAKVSERVENYKPAASEWKPIEQAPRDGTLILAKMKGGYDYLPLAWESRSGWWAFKMPNSKIICEDEEIEYFCIIYPPQEKP